ncbi:MAG: DEAD/DEAH box helicase [Actinobacteria bacterium]|nr:MAG: DEAD/DEAH box helicase [Actinomycetota bacterium]
MKSFAELGVREALAAVLAQQGITDPFPIQEQTIPDAIARRDVCGKAKTGSGKTLAFGLPILQSIEPGAPKAHPRALVLAPTRELARQIVDVLRPLARAVDLRVDPFYGGTAIQPQHNALHRGVDIAVATPGRLIDLLQTRAIRLDGLQVVVIDEADRMADMGFLPQVEWIMRRLNAAQPQVLLFSATLDGDVDVLVRRYLHDPVFHDVVEDDDAPEVMLHRFFEVHHMDRVRVAAAISRGAARTLVFVRTKRGADRLVRQLSGEGLRAEAIHGDLRQQARERALKRFRAGDLEALVATDVAARGLHIDEVDVVIHYDLPEDPKAYVHRSGRTARAGRTGAVATFVLWDQHVEADRLKRQLQMTEPTVQIFSNDPRLADLPSFQATETEATGTDGSPARQSSGFATAGTSHTSPSRARPRRGRR